MVDTRDLKSLDHLNGRAGSSPARGTNQKYFYEKGNYFTDISSYADDLYVVF